jgi:hypothetical protein
MVPIDTMLGIFKKTNGWYCLRLMFGYIKYGRVKVLAACVLIASIMCLPFLLSSIPFLQKYVSLMQLSVVVLVWMLIFMCIRYTVSALFKKYFRQFSRIPKGFDRGYMYISFLLFSKWLQVSDQLKLSSVRALKEVLNNHGKQHQRLCSSLFGSGGLGFIIVGLIFGGIVGFYVDWIFKLGLHEADYGILVSALLGCGLYLFMKSMLQGDRWRIGAMITILEWIEERVGEDGFHQAVAEIPGKWVLGFGIDYSAKSSEDLVIKKSD